MNGSEKIVKLKLDIIFKRVFGNEKNKNIIAAFISDLLEIPRESIKAIIIDNVELTPEYYDQKFSRLDLKLNVDNRIVNIEIQVNNEPDFRERTLFYWSKIYSDELKAGDEYETLKQTICINIINFNLFEYPDYHSHFKVMENVRHEVLTDKFSIHFFELKKVGNNRKSKPMEDWLSLIDAETESDLMAIQQNTSIPEVRDTIVMLRQLSADENIRREAYYREKRLHDEASALGSARRQGREEGRKEGRIEGLIEGKKEGLIEGKKEGKKEGRIEERNSIAAIMKAKGYTDEQIKDILG